MQSIFDAQKDLYAGLRDGSELISWVIGPEPMPLTFDFSMVKAEFFAQIMLVWRVNAIVTHVLVKFSPILEKRGAASSIQAKVHFFRLLADPCC